MAGDAILRPAGPDDLAGLLALYAELNPDDPPMDAATAKTHFAAILAQPGMTIYVAVKDGIPLTSCTLVIVPKPHTRRRALCAYRECRDRRSRPPDGPGPRRPQTGRRCGMAGRLL